MQNISDTTGAFDATFDQQSIFYRSWVHPDPIGCVYIAHGMSEHSGRYADFARFLCGELSVSVFATDHRGHGRTACPQDESEIKNLGIFQTSKDLSAVNCLEIMGQDLLDLVKRNHSEKPLPIILFGHSMGSLVARWAIRLSSADILSQIRGVVLSGIPTTPGAHERGPLLLLLNMGLAMGRGRDTLHEFIMGKFDDEVRKIRKNPKLPKSCFISSAEAELAAFHADPLCGQTVDLHIWKSVRSTMIGLMDPKSFFSSLGDTKLSFVYVSGRLDPICNYGHTAELQSRQLAKLGHEVTEVYLSGCQHEFLHETERVRKIGLEQVGTWMKCRL